jgi:hypothetical protein
VTGILQNSEGSLGSEPFKRIESSTAGIGLGLNNVHTVWGVFTCTGEQVSL